MKKRFGRKGRVLKLPNLKEGALNFTLYK
jgi:hypothetical protein